MATQGGRPTTTIVGGKSAAAGSQLPPGSLTARSPASEKPRGPLPLFDRLMTDATQFDFFQAVRIFDQMARDGQPVGLNGPPGEENVRFRTHIALSFPSSSIYEVQPPQAGRAMPTMAVQFFGLVGQMGVLPRHYTEVLLRHEREAKYAEKRALRDWYDLFTHRMLSLFYRSWTKYRFFIPYERGEHLNEEPDPYTHALLSLAGIGLPTLRQRIKIRVAEPAEITPAQQTAPTPVLAKIDDLALLHYAGLLARRPRTAAGLQNLLQDFFEMPVEVRQFHGKWLWLQQSDQSQLGALNCELGQSTVIGDRVWDVEGSFHIQLGPLNYEDFCQFVPDRAATTDRKAFFLLSHLVRLYIGPTMEFDVQALLAADAVPELQLARDSAPGPRLGWNTWIRGQPFPAPVGDAVFSGEEVFSMSAT